PRSVAGGRQRNRRAGVDQHGPLELRERGLEPGHPHRQCPVLLGDPLHDFPADAERPVPSVLIGGRAYRTPPGTSMRARARGALAPLSRIQASPAAAISGSPPSSAAAIWVAALKSSSLCAPVSACPSFPSWLRLTICSR